MPEPYWSDGSATLYLGDCETVLRDLLATDSVMAHIVVTSPPYNMGLVPGGNGRGMYRPGAGSKGGRFRAGYGDHADAMPQDEYDAFHRRVLALLWQVIPEDGAIFWNHRQRIEHGKARLPLGMDFGIPLRQVITWDRGTGIAPSLRHFAPVAEWVFLFAKPEFSLESCSQSGFGDIWRLGMAREGYGHPAPFPESLPLRAIDSCGARSVLDPFAGTGTTLVAARRRSIPATGVELCERWCEVIASRLSIAAPERLCSDQASLFGLEAV
jgi:site-specific DNA-methyltransferase (adenine-specific)